MTATHSLDVESVRSLFGKRLNGAVLGMADGKPRAGKLKWYFDEIAKPIVRVKPLGNYPDAAVEKIAQGRSFSKVTAPLHETLAFLRMVAGIKSKPLCQALRDAQKESGEAASARVALCMAQMSRSELESYIKETEEEIEAATASVESARAALLGMGK